MSEVYSSSKRRRAPKRKSSANEFFGYDEHKGSYKHYGHTRSTSQTISSANLRNINNKKQMRNINKPSFPRRHRRVQSESFDTSPFADFGGEASDNDSDHGENEPSIYDRHREDILHEEGEPSKELNEDSLIRALYRRSPPPAGDLSAIPSPSISQTLTRTTTSSTRTSTHSDTKHQQGPPHRHRKNTPTFTPRPTSNQTKTKTQTTHKKQPTKQTLKTSTSTTTTTTRPSSMSTNITGRVKIIFLGVAGVGKTSLIRRFDRQDIICPRATMSVDFLKMIRQIGDSNLEVYIWDTAGQERFRALSLGYYRSAHGAVLVESIDSFSDAKRLDVFYDNLKRHGPIEHDCKCVLLLNKSDLFPDRNAAVFEQVSRWASDKNMPVFLTSALTGDNVDDGIECLLRSIVDDKSLRKHVMLSETKTAADWTTTDRDTLRVKNARPGSRLKNGNCRC